ncbi:MAG: Helix-turn-helix domain [Thermomicrobiales bacterium]|jgi:excisionase family DNA binding protein|nr:Helix-turn-helix domain [Thermomicrobiales bacterium]
MADDTGGFLTVAETAKLLQRSTEQIRRYLREGTLPGRRLGGQWFVQRADAEVFVRQRNEATDFVGALRADDPDPLAGAIAIGSGGGDIAVGRIAYIRSLDRAR